MKELVGLVAGVLLLIPALWYACDRVMVAQNGLPLGMTTAPDDCECIGAYVLLSSNDRTVHCIKCGKTKPLPLKP